MTDNNSLAPQTSPVTSIQLSKLPSKGITYPEGATISFRTYGYGEIKKISSSNMSEREAFALVLSGINTNFDKNSITFGDFMYLALFRKIATLGTPKFQVPYKTPINGETRVHAMSVEELEIQDLEVPELPINLTMTDGKVLEFSPITVGDVMHLLAKGKIKDPTSLMSIQVRNHKFEEVEPYLHSITNTDDLSDLGEVERLLSHNIKPVKFECVEKNKNGQDETNTVVLRLEGRQALLLPFREEGVPARSRISFGTRS